MALYEGSQGLVGGRMGPYLDGARVSKAAARQKVEPKDANTQPKPCQPRGNTPTVGAAAVD